MITETLSPDEARAIVYGEHEGWSEVQVEVTDTTRWSILKSGVFLRLTDNTFWEFDWSEGATEQQDESAYEYDSEVTIIRVKQVLKVIKAYEVDNEPLPPPLDSRAHQVQVNKETVNIEVFPIDAVDKPDAEALDVIVHVVNGNTVRLYVGHRN